MFTALSVGIGFGLQYLAADIASEVSSCSSNSRSASANRITIGEDEGDVHGINCEPPFFTLTIASRSSCNSRLVSQRVINWSTEIRARIAIPISVAQASDVNLVTETLLRC